MKKEKWYRPLISAYRRRKAKRLITQVKQCIDNCPDKIPVILVSYNNGSYVRNMVSQLAEYQIQPIIIDNNSSDTTTLKILKKMNSESMAKIAYSDINFGHMVGFLDPIYKLLPEVFAYSDPDLQFNDKLPEDFLTQLSELTERYQVYKAGFALDLIENEEIIDVNYPIKSTKPFQYSKQFTIRKYEQRYWRKQLLHKRLEIFCAPIDTTFAVYRKSNFEGNFYDGVRVASDFTAIHIPWFPKKDFMSKEEKDKYLKNNKSTTWVK